MTNRSPLEFPEKIKDGDHLVQFYNSDEFLADAVTTFIAPALMCGEGAIIVATEAHLHLFEKALQDSQINTSLLRLSGQLLLLDADLTLKSFMVNDIPDPLKFHLTIGGALTEMTSKYPGVKAYGEMVNILWNEGNIYGTIALEKLWTELMSQKKFSLLCAYSLESMCEDKLGVAFSEVCKCHTHVMPAEGVIEASSSNDQLKRITELQYNIGIKDKLLKDSKLNSLEMMIPLTSLKIQLREMKNVLERTPGSCEVELNAIILKCENQLNRMRNIIEKLSK